MTLVLPGVPHGFGCACEACTAQRFAVPVSAELGYSTRRFAFYVPGKAQTKGSMIPGRTKDGRMFVRNDNPKEAGWRQTIGLAAREAMAGASPLEGPVALDLTIWRVRPRGHFGAKGLKASAPRLPASRPDASKVLRAVEDALNGIVFQDDAQITTHVIRKRWAQQDGISVAVEEEVAHV